MKLFNLKKKNAARGFTLIEILLVVGFIALLSIGIFMTYNKVQSGNVANTEARNIATIQAGIKNIYAGSVDYSTITVTALLQAYVVPDSMRSPAGAAATQIMNTFGGTVTVAPTAFNGGTNNAFDITYNNVSLDVCSKLASVAGQNFNKVLVGGTAVKDTSAGLMNIDPAATATACAAGAATGVAMDFISL
jgi:type II secretory pathway pseudopilin PulG